MEQSLGERLEAQVSKSLLPMESHRMGLILTVASYDNMVKCCLSGKLIRDSAQGFYWELITEHALLTDSQRKVSSQHKPHCQHAV
jgi:hypothetical protein